MSSLLSKNLLSWYAQHARDLPWRGSADPYAIWVSEIMLQQTRVETVIPYFQRWMIAFPDIQTLAAASQQAVLNLWEGLGYYRRARALHQAAQILITDFGGQLPHSTNELRGLPGIGPYTAAAIASIAFNVDAAALDGNIRRVLSRVFNISAPIGSSQSERQLRALSQAQLPVGGAGDFNQALMDLGAGICTPRSPDCASCPLSDLCQAQALGLQAVLPVKTAKAAIPHYTVTAAVIHRNGQILIAQRALEGLLGGMWEFPGGKRESGETLASCLKREIYEELGVIIKVSAPVGSYKHAFTHFRVTLHAFHCSLPRGTLQRKVHNDLRWVTPAQFEDYPMGKIDRMISQTILGKKSMPKKALPKNKSR